MTKTVFCGGVAIGGQNPISVQSMTNTPTCEINQTLEQIEALKAAGCDIVRLAVPDVAAAKAFGRIKQQSPLPMVADIHFDYKAALEAICQGADKIRINPGNIGGKERVRQVAAAAAARKIPIRVGVNGGSLEKDLLTGGLSRPAAMAESARRHIAMLEECDFTDIVVSLKASSVADTVAAYRLMRQSCSYPFHVGVTEAGTAYSGIIKSAAGIGALLLDGIGDTIRVSLTENPAEEVRAGIALLKALELRGGPRLISCPTCGRTKIDLISLAKAVEERLDAVSKDITVAVMGCVVNGPGEASAADIGIAGGDGCAVLFKKGTIVRKLEESEIIDALMEEIWKL